MIRTFLLLLGALCAGFCGAAMAQAAVTGDAQTADDLRKLAHPAMIFVGSGAAGMLSHFIKKWTRNEIDGGIIDYFVKDHGRRTVASIGSFASTAVTMALTHQLDGLGLVPLIMLGFTTGSTFDSYVNKGVPAPPK